MRSVSSYFVPVIAISGYVFLFAPLLILVIYSFNQGRTTVVWEGFTLGWYWEALKDRNLRSGLSVSALVAVASALASTAIGTASALAVVKHPFPGKAIFSTLVIAPIVLPEIVLAVGLLVATVWAGLPLGYATLVAGHVLVSIPFCFLIVRAAAANLDPRLDEAASDLGANGFAAFRKVTLPLLMPAIGSALMLSAILSFDNFTISTFVSGVGTTPLPIEIYSMLKSGLTPKLNALGAFLILFNVVALLAVIRTYLKFTRNNS